MNVRDLIADATREAEEGDDAVLALMEHAHALGLRLPDPETFDPEDLDEREGAKDVLAQLDVVWCKLGALLGRPTH